MIRAGRMGSFEMSPRGGGGIPTKKEEQGEEKEWEMRPGGMLVQKRSPDSESAAAAAGGPPVPTIRVKVKYESAYYEIYLGAQSTFGELKKMLAERTGLHHQDQKILYKDKERDSSAFLDVCGVKDKSKLVMAMDPTAHAKRVLEMHRAAKLEKAAKSVKGIATEVDNLALQVSNTEATIYEGKEEDLIVILMGNCLSGHDPWSGFKHNHLALGKVIVQSSKKKKPAHNNGNGENVPVSTNIGSVPASSNIVSVPLTSAIGSVPVTGNYVTAVEAPKDIGDLQQLTSLRDLTIFTYKELTMATDYFRPDLILGEGGFGLVYKGVIDEKVRRGFKSTKVAVKELNPDGHQGDREWLAEVNYLGQFSHPNLVRLVGYCYEDKHRLLVYEYMAHGSLETHLFRRHNTLTWPIRMKIALDAAKGLAFLHGAERPIIFRDFKTSNILLDAEFNAKLSDFGLAKEGPMGDQTHVSTRVMGTYGYAAPEYIMTGHLTTKSDVYGFGVVLLEIILGKRALDKRRPKHEQNLVDWARPLLIRTTKLLRVIDPKVQGQYTSKTASKVGNLAHRCLSENPKIRPTMKEVVETLETYNQEETMYQSDRAAGNIQGVSEETFDRPDGQQTVARAGSGGMESVVHGRGEIKQGNERNNGDSPPPEESDHPKHSPPLESIGVNNNNTHARPPPERSNYER